MTATTHAPAQRFSNLWPTLILVLWGAGIFTLAANGWFVQPAPTLPLHLATAFGLPPLIFLAAHQTLPAVRAWVASLDLALIVLAQSWRVLGMVFLFLWALDELPGTFALPAGLGDTAVGIFAVFVGIKVLRQTHGWQTQTRWLIAAGTLDFAVAFSTAVLSGAGRPLNLPGAPPPDLMQSLPMILIPAYGVPIFLILHLIAWIKLRS
ncbi:MAG: hypothetical protein ACRC14_02005 [Paracoccaceae bacterium]